MTTAPMHAGIHAELTPDRPALIMGGSGASLDFAGLEARSNRFAHLVRSLGITSGDRVALLLENCLDYLVLAWGAQRSGLRVVPIATHLAPDEVDYILRDSGSKLLVTSPCLASTARRLDLATIPATARFAIAPGLPGFADLDAALGAMPTHPVSDQSEGVEMPYSSGTTGRPKGILRALPDGPFGIPSPGYVLAARLFGFDAGTVYLSPAPLYHAAPLMFCMRIMRFGGTIVVMERFDAEDCLRLIERYRVTHAQWVPTMFIRMLRLPGADRTGRDLSSLRCAIHAAAPCPEHVKRAMIDWFGPIILEYYAGSEGNGLTLITTQEWLEHPGSVGRAIIGELRICDDEGAEVPQGTEGVVYFADGPEFSYHNDPEKTRSSRTASGWSTLGDIGYVDADGYLYLTDRKANMIISGGVNIYPQEVENLLLGHPGVLDAAVIGVPDEEFGESVKAVVHPVDMTVAGPGLEAELIAWCRERLSRVKCPRSIDFDDALPRQENGKLYKRLLRDRYRAAGG